MVGENALDVLGARGPKHVRTNFGRLEEPRAVPAQVLTHGGEPRGPTQRLEITGVLEGDLEPLGKGDRPNGVPLNLPFSLQGRGVR